MTAKQIFCLPGEKFQFHSCPIHTTIVQRMNRIAFLDRAVADPDVRGLAPSRRCRRPREEAAPQ